MKSAIHRWLPFWRGTEQWPFPRVPRCSHALHANDAVITLWENIICVRDRFRLLAKRLIINLEKMDIFLSAIQLWGQLVWIKDQVLFVRSFRSRMQLTIQEYRLQLNVFRLCFWGFIIVVFSEE